MCWTPTRIRPLCKTGWKFKTSAYSRSIHFDLQVMQLNPTRVGSLQGGVMADWNLTMESMSSGLPKGVFFFWTSVLRKFYLQNETFFNVFTKMVFFIFFILKIHIWKMCFQVEGGFSSNWSCFSPSPFNYLNVKLKACFPNLILT